MQMLERLSALMQSTGQLSGQLVWFGQFFGETKQRLAAVHLGPDVAGRDVQRLPEYCKVEQEVGAFLNERLTLLLNSLDRCFGRFFD